jgi:hypothetical protein
VWLPQRLQLFSENSDSEEMEKEEDIINLISQTSDVESLAILQS